jgi:DNA ligase-associated metallophosphoesterase
LIKVGGLGFEPLPSGAAVCEGALFAADLHLGKEAAFRQSGVAVPEGATAATLAALSQDIKEAQAHTLVLLGDLYHAPSAVDERLMDILSRWRFATPALEIIFVRGNHDRGAPHLPGMLAMEEAEEGAEWRGIALRHHPVGHGPGLAGHLHPAVRLQAGKESRKLSCFWLSQGELVLPAYGGFTGSMVISPRPDDEIWVVAGRRVMKAPTAACGA